MCKDTYFTIKTEERGLELGPCVCCDLCRNGIQGPRLYIFPLARPGHRTQNTKLAPTTHQTRGRLAVCNLGSVMILLASIRWITRQYVSYKNGNNLKFYGHIFLCFRERQRAMEVNNQMSMSPVASSLPLNLNSSIASAMSTLSRLT